MITDVAGAFTVIDCPQRSPEWFAARLGRVTGSVAAAMMANGRKKGEESVQRRDLRLRLALERITGIPDESDYTSKDMAHGIETEAEALAAFEAHTGQMVQHSGFLSHDGLMAGCSLDGHIGDFAGIVEAKCPKPATHLRYLTGKTLPDDYRWQVVHGLFVTNATYCDFVSYHPKFPPELRLFHVRVSVDDFDIQAYHLALRFFLGEVEAEVEAITKMAREAA